MNPYKYYIVNYSNLRDLFYYNKAFEDYRSAREIIDSYLGEGYFKVFRGSYLSFLNLPKRKASFLKFLPKYRRIHRGTLNHYINKKRSRLKGRGILPYKFKAIWDPMPETRRERKRYVNKDKGYIRNRILNE